MLLKKLFYKAFIGGKWLVGYRRKDSVDNYYQFATKDLPREQWVADPFLFEHNGQHYLFCEQYETKLNRAGIGYFLFENGTPVNKGIVIRQPYHMSYPCVFSFGNDIYMIPETSANKTVELYKAVSFPNQWELDTVLLQNVQYVDSTVCTVAGKVYLLSYTKKQNKWALVVFSLDMENRKLTQMVEKIYDTNIARPAGSLWQAGDRLLRPAQDCSQKYGEALYMYAVDELNEERFEEHCLEKICIDQFTFPQKVHRIHTLNRDSEYEVVDVFCEKFDLLHGWKIFKRLILKH